MPNPLDLESSAQSIRPLPCFPASNPDFTVVPLSDLDFEWQRGWRRNVSNSPNPPSVKMGLNVNTEKRLSCFYKIFSKLRAII